MKKIQARIYGVLALSAAVVAIPGYLAIDRLRVASETLGGPFYVEVPLDVLEAATDRLATFGDAMYGRGWALANEAV